MQAERPDQFQELDPKTTLQLFEEAKDDKDPIENKKNVRIEEVFDKAYRFAKSGCGACIGKGWYILERKGKADMKTLCGCLWKHPVGRQVMKAVGAQQPNARMETITDWRKKVKLIRGGKKRK